MKSCSQRVRLRPVYWTMAALVWTGLGTRLNDAIVLAGHFTLRRRVNFLRNKFPSIRPRDAVEDLDFQQPYLVCKRAGDLL